MTTISQNKTQKSQPQMIKIASKQLPIHQKKQLKDQNQLKIKTINTIRSNKKSPTIVQKKIIQHKISLPIKQFLYGSMDPSNKKRSQSHAQINIKYQVDSQKQFMKLDQMPIKIIKDKIQFQQNTKNKNFNSVNNQTNQIIPRLDGQNPQTSTNQNGHKKLQFMSTYQNVSKISPKQKSQLKEKLYKPKMNFFQRYNYENYENYQYANSSYKHQNNFFVQKNEGSDRYRFPTNEKYQPHKGSMKNLQIIFCETKHPDFVRRSNGFYEISTKNQLQTARKLQLLSNNHSCTIKSDIHNKNDLKSMKQNLLQSINTDSRKLFNSNNAIKWSYQSTKTEPQVRKAVNPEIIKSKLMTLKNYNPKSTLEKHLQQFRSLQKLTQLHQHEQSTNSKYKNTQNQIQDYSRTVLVSIIVYKFPFLQNLNRSFRNHLLKSIFELDNIGEKSKISIHQYLKFNRIFASKDSSVQELSIFLVSLLFKNSPNPSLETAAKVISQLNPKDKRKLQSVILELFQIFYGIKICYETIMNKFLQNVCWLHSMIDLVKDQ